MLQVKFMKKSKLLSVFAVVLAMGITACQKPADQPSGKSGEQSQVPSDHKHSFDNWEQTKAPTCTEKGEEKATCSCGEVKTREVKALGHDWGEWEVKKAASCSEDGLRERTCKREGCGAKEEEVIKADHDWDAEQAVAAGTDPADQVGYKLANCKKGDAIKVDIKAVDAKFYKGKIKESTSNPTPEGYFKLDANGSKAYWKFTVQGTKMYKGMLYQLGAMDSFSGNTERTYAQTSTSGDHAPKYPLGNFDVQVNGDSIDKSEWIDVPYSELLAEGEDSSAMGDGFSPICLAPIGEAVIQPGLNEITYERLGSYNLIISDLIFIGAEFEHVHAAASEWSSDETNHWHACTAVGCPTGKLDVAAHTFEEVAAEGVAATCKAEGKKVEKCSVCGFKKETVLPKLAHTLGEAYDIVPATCEAAGSQKKKCSVCNEVVEEVLPKIAHQFGDVVENYAAGEGFIATSSYNCSVCSKSALRWSARDFDTAASATDLDLTHDGNKSVRFASGAVENKGGVESVGSHIIYNVKVDAAVEKAGLSFKIKNTNGSGWGANASAPVFKTIDGDSSLGAIKNADGTFTTATHRYGLKINDVEYLLGDDNYGNKAGVTDWFDWPVEFPLKAGINKVDVFAYAGYRADLYEFQFTGLPHVTPSHLHNGDATWLNDADNHWHKCTGEGCPLADGIYDKAAHTWGEKYDEVAATCSAKGSYKVKCTVCDYVKTVEVAKAAHTWGEAQAAIGDAIPHECSVCHAMGYELVVASPAKLKSDLTWNITGLPAGNYEIQLNACAAATTLPQKFDSRYQFKVDSGEYIGASDDNLTYADYGLGTGEAIGNVQWSKPINTIAVGADAAQFTLHWTNKGYSAFIAGVRLVKVAA